MMAHWADEQFAAAVDAGAREAEAAPRALAASYGADDGMVRVTLSNGCSFSFPARRVQGLEAAPDAALADVAPLGAGHALEWSSLDVQMSLVGLMSGLFGTERYMAELGRAGGRARSTAKAEAARRNGQRGGRPRRQAKV
jgi:hypothetical protein